LEHRIYEQYVVWLVVIKEFYFELMDKPTAKWMTQANDHSAALSSYSALNQ